MKSNRNVSALSTLEDETHSCKPGNGGLFPRKTSVHVQRVNEKWCCAHTGQWCSCSWGCGHVPKAVDRPVCSSAQEVTQGIQGMGLALQILLFAEEEIAGLYCSTFLRSWIPPTTHPQSPETSFLPVIKTSVSYFRQPSPTAASVLGAVSSDCRVLQAMGSTERGHKMCRLKELELLRGEGAEHCELSSADFPVFFPVCVH